MGLIGPGGSRVLCQRHVGEATVPTTARGCGGLEAWFAFPTIEVTPALFRAAVGLQQRFQLSYWDAAIVAAAKQMGCRTVYSENLNDG